MAAVRSRRSVRTQLRVTTVLRGQLRPVGCDNPSHRLRGLLRHSFVLAERTEVTDQMASSANDTCADGYARHVQRGGGPPTLDPQPPRSVTTLVDLSVSGSS